MTARRWRSTSRRSAVWPGLLALTLLLACQIPSQVTIVLGPSPTPGVGHIAPPATPSPAVRGTAPATPPRLAPTPSPNPTPTAPPSPTAPIAHTMRPGEPVFAERLWDATCLESARQGPPIVPPRGDDYFVNLYERPFEAQSQATYFPELDIRRADIGTDGTWVYVRLELAALPPDDTAPRAYGVELDLDIDGRGEWLIWAHTPLSTEWQVAGVQAFQDADQDVGETRACRADPPQDGSSYETLVFDAGHGPDSDAVWARWVPRDRPEVQFAIKYDLIQRAPAFMWWVWADRGVDQPGWMDYHDHFTADEAGSPFPANRYYPARALAQVDNTCHWVFGFQPTGNEPCICAGNFPTPTPTITPTPTPTEPPQGGRIQGYFYKDRNANGRYDPGEGVSSVGVSARRGTCGSPMAPGGHTASGADGSFVLEVPVAGTWCVIPDSPAPWEPQRIQVNVPPGGSTGPIYFRAVSP